MVSLKTIKSVLITGCSSGFGRLLIPHFLTEGWHVVAITRHPECLQDNKNNRLSVLSLNITSKQDRATLVEYVNNKHANGLDCLINNAGYSLAGPLESLTDEQIYRQFDVNLFAPLFLTRDLLPSLRKAKGKLINISSVLGYVGMPMQSLYTASKFALEGLSESLYYELAAHGVQVILVEPGGFRTRFAENTEWPTIGLQKPNLLYHQQLEGYSTFLRRSSTKGKGNNPEEVANFIIQLIKKRKVPLRQRIGADAQALYYLRRFLPARIADTVLHKLSQRILETS